MSNYESSASAIELRLSEADIRRAASENVLPADQAERLIEWGYEQRALTPGPAPAAATTATYRLHAAHRQPAGSRRREH